MRRAGFTIIETMITIALIALFVGLGGPALSTAIQNNRIRNAAEALREGIDFARLEAIKRNSRVQLAFASRPQPGWEVTTEDGEVLLKQGSEESAARTEIEADAAAVTFDGLGRMVNNFDATEAATVVTFKAVPDRGNRTLRVSISQGGIPRLCNPGAPAGSLTACP